MCNTDSVNLNKTFLKQLYDNNELDMFRFPLADSKSEQYYTTPFGLILDKKNARKRMRFFKKMRKAKFASISVWLLQGR